MKRYFLVDFENVADAGLNGFFDLTAEDTVDIFYTQKNNRISMDFFTVFLERGSAAALCLRKVAAGNQALDLQLASFLGSLIAASDEECEYCIISKDKGFACLPAFWENQKGGGSVRQAGSIREALSPRAQQLVPPAAPAAAPKAPAVPTPRTPAVPTPRAPVVPAVKAPAVPAAKAPAAPAKTTEAPADAAKGPAAPADAEKPEAPEPEKPKAPVPADAEKPAADAEKTKSAAQPNEKTVLNVKVQQALSKAKCDTQIISQTASLIAKAFGDPKIKQIVYRDLIKLYGQKQGLEVYNLVKPVL